MSTFYVYRWENLITGLCYIGKGYGSRAFAHACNALSDRAGVLPEAMRESGLHNFRLSFLASGLSSAEALRIERESIYTLDTKWPNGYNMRGGVKPLFIGPPRRPGRPAKFKPAPPAKVPAEAKRPKVYRKMLFTAPHLR